MKKYIVLSIFFSLPLPLVAAQMQGEATLLGESSDWQAHKYFEQDEKGIRIPVCALSSFAIVSFPKTFADRKPRAYVSRRKKEGGRSWFYEIAIKFDVALLPAPSPERAPILSIGEKQFNLFVGATRSGAEAAWAWVLPKDIRNVLTLMRYGTDMELVAFIGDERQVRDKFSLFGISKGLALINKSCAQ